MSFEESPSLDDYRGGLSDKPSTPTDRKKTVRLALLIFLSIVLLLTIANFFKSQTAGLLAGKGSVEGRAVDENGDPFVGDIFIVGVDMIIHTTSDGYFFLKNIPSGDQSLVVADETSGQTYQIQVAPGQTTNVGEVKFLATATPGR
jgi:hypothetical protein